MLYNVNLLFTLFKNLQKIFIGGIYYEKFEKCFINDIINNFNFSF